MRGESHLMRRRWGSRSFHSPTGCLAGLRTLDAVGWNAPQSAFCGPLSGVRDSGFVLFDARGLLAYFLYSARHEPWPIASPRLRLRALGKLSRGRAALGRRFGLAAQGRAQSLRSLHRPYDLHDMNTLRPVLWQQMPAAKRRGRGHWEGCAAVTQDLWLLLACP